ncbi:hypothetical protein M514_05835 [Trichuris suis]|nr:hypothetical protein M514_05835 [Trichuris suis]
MGSPLSVVLTELFMVRLEEKAFERTDNLVNHGLFNRYVDDILPLLKEDGKALSWNTGRRFSLTDHIYDRKKGWLIGLSQFVTQSSYALSFITLRWRYSRVATPTDIKNGQVNRTISIMKTFGPVKKHPAFKIIQDRAPKAERPGVVYEIKCGSYASYIGETGNTLLDRFNEHMKALNGYRTAKEELSGMHRKRQGRP